MTSHLDVRPVRLGAQTPTIVHHPPDVASLADAEEAIELADAYEICSGNPLSESQRFRLRSAMGTRPNGKWAAAAVGDFGGRQGAGKTDTIKARELHGLIVLGEPLIIHTAHEFKTANESFLDMASLFEDFDDLRKRVQRIRYGNGEQGVEFKSGQRLKYFARTGGSGRGFRKSALTVYDEAQHLQSEHVAASGPTRLAHPNPQAWYAGSGGFSWSKQAWAMRKRALSGNGGRLSYCEHTAEDIRVVDGRVVSIVPRWDDREAWAQANPGLNRWVDEEAFEDLWGELGAPSDPSLGLRELLCVWEPEPSDDEDPPRMAPADWAGCTIPSGQAPHLAPGEVVLGFDVSQGWGSISVASGTLANAYAECIRHQPGWSPADLVARTKRWKPTAIAVDGGTGENLAAVSETIEAFRLEGLNTDLIKVLSGPQYKAACQGWVDAVAERRLTRPRFGEGQPDNLEIAGAKATARMIGDSWVWDTRVAKVPLSPLKAATVARSMLNELAVEPDEEANLW